MTFSFLIHPILFSLYPVLFLFSCNMDETPLKQILRPLLIVLIFTVLILSILCYLFKDKYKSSLVVSLFLVLFFSFGHICNISYSLTGKVLNTYVLILLILILVFISYVIIKTGRDLKKINTIINYIAITLMAITFYNIIMTGIKLEAYSAGFQGISDSSLSSNVSDTDILPNIYYIIIDTYTNENILKDLYDYDNSDFIGYLKEKGFYVPVKSKTNYCCTALSLASSLNMEHITDIEVDSETNDLSVPTFMVKNSKVVDFLKQHGYTFISFSTGWNITEMWNADIYIDSLLINEFEWIIIHNTPLYKIFFYIIPTHEMLRYQCLKTFEKIPETTEYKAPFFAFIHMLGLHPPYVFDENGEYPENNNMSMNRSNYTHEEYVEGFTKQLSFYNKNLKEVIDHIVKNSPEPTIIILQGDHGPSLYDIGNNSEVFIREKTSILNAYYFSDRKCEGLYEGITPVNTFRVIFNKYFHTDLPLLEDRNYFSTSKKLYKFFDVTEMLNHEKRK